MTHLVADYYKAVRIDGGLRPVAEAKKWFQANGVSLADSSSTCLILEDVPHSALGDLRRIASHFKLETLSCLGRYQGVRTNEEEPRSVTATSLNLTPGKWYYADAVEDQYPLVFVRESGINHGSQIWDVDLLESNNSIPRRKLLSAEALSKFGLRPATADDFDAFNLPVPFANYLISADAQPVKANLAHLSSFGLGSQKVEATTMDPEAVRAFVDLMSTQLADWTRVDGSYSAFVEDEELVHQVNDLIGNWASSFRFPERGATATQGEFKWTYSEPGSGTKPIVVTVKATLTPQEEDSDIVGPWLVEIVPSW